MFDDRSIRPTYHPSCSSAGRARVTELGSARPLPWRQPFAGSGRCVSFREDERRIRNGHGAENFSRLSRFALDLFERNQNVKLGI